MYHSESSINKNAVNNLLEKEMILSLPSVFSMSKLPQKYVEN